MTHIWGTGTWASDSWDSSVQWGGDDWGIFGWGDLGTNPPYTLATLLDYWPHQTTLPEPEEPTGNLLEAIASYMADADADIEEAYEQRFLQTASDERLEDLANEVGLTRQTGELDEHLRLRTLIQKAGTQSDGTFDAFEQLLATIFGDEVGKLSIDKQANTPAVVLTVPQDVQDSIPLTQDELEAGLQKTLPASTPLTIVTGDILILGESGANGVGGKVV